MPYFRDAISTMATPMDALAARAAAPAWQLWKHFTVGFTTPDSVDGFNADLMPLRDDLGRHPVF